MRALFKKVLAMTSCRARRFQSWPRLKRWTDWGKARILGPAFGSLLAFVCAIAFYPALQVQAASDAARPARAEKEGAATSETSLGAPAALALWKDWVLYKSEQLFCPPAYKDANRHACSFPARLKLTMNKNECVFTQSWRLYDRGRAILPSGKGLWPEQVRANGKDVAVIDAGGTPVVLLEAGDYEISGKLAWNEAPEFLQLAADTGIVEIIKDGKPEPFPDLAPDGRLNLARRSTAKSPEDSLDVVVFRKFRDSLPAEIATLIRLEVAGKARRIALQNVLPQKGVPLAIASPLPLRFGPDGGIDVQAGPGRWDIEVVVRLDGSTASLGPLPTPYGREFWAFQAENELRVVEVGGVPAVDPQTTNMPAEWKRFPTYMVDRGSTMTLQQMHRGAADSTVDALTLTRTLWLDFDGAGLTVKDHIGGRVRQGWTLTMPPPAALGRVTLDGKDETILLLGPDQAPGIELRKGNTNLTAESRYERFDGLLACTGWDRDFQSLKATLNLPPGWRMLAATGVDKVSDSWISRWTLWDIFFALVVALAIMKFQRPWAGICALLFFALAMHEPNSPRFVWAFLLAAAALVKLFSTSSRLAEWTKTHGLVQIFYAAALIAMAAAAIPFAFQQIRWGMYPQLEQPGLYAAARGGDGAGAPSMLMKQSAEAPAEVEMSTDMAVRPEPAPAVRPAAPPPPKQSYTRSKEKKEEARQLMMYDPEALVQTGPGVPVWQWRRVELSWNGPVARGESLRVWLLPPAANLALAIARVLLLGLALWPLMDLKRFRPKPLAAMATLVAFAGLLYLGPEQAVAAEFPSEQLLQSYRERLLEPAPCFPNCAGSPHIAVQLEQERLRLVYTLHLATRATVPLPVVSERWQPREVLLDEQPAQVYREAGSLWLLAPEGVHRVVLEGPAPRALSFQISLPLASKRAAVVAPGWNIQGIAADGRLEGAIHLSRLQQPDAPEQAGQAEQAGLTYRIPPFLHVERKLALGLTWEAVTTVRRVTPTGEPVVLEVPLLTDEAVLTEAVEVKEGRIRLNMAPAEREVSWRSKLSPRAEILLTAPQNVPWVETWTLSASPIWDLAIEGVPATRNLDGQDTWAPVWRPWPGEKVTVAVTRPKTAPGASMTIEDVALASKVGSRLDENKLTLRIRASKGSRQTLRIPAEAEVLAFRNQEREFPKLGEKPGELTFPVTPGLQTIDLEWRQPRAGSTLLALPEIHVQHPAVNVSLRLSVPQDRWTLFIWGGTRQGPAVLYWSYLAGMLALAFALGFLPWSPLKRWQWLLLGLGLSQVDIVSAGLAVAWLVALGVRREHFPRYGWFWYNAMQVALVAMALLGLSGLYDAVHQGLLGHPEMQIRGNGSSWQQLIWNQDRVADLLPQPTALTVPLYVYRLVMLAWSLWLAASLLSWLRWGWDSFAQGGLFRRVQFGFKFSPLAKSGKPGQQDLSKESKD